MTRVIVHCISRSFAGLFLLATRATARGSTVLLRLTFRFPTRYRPCHTWLFVGDAANSVI